MSEDVLVHSVEFTGRNGARIHLQTVSIIDPIPWGENPEGVTENYYVIDEGNGPALIQVVSNQPFCLQQLDLASPKGAEHWQRLQSLIAESNK